MIPLSELHPFEGHPLRVVDDEEMQKTVESVKQYGILTPAIARPNPDGGYEIISGHRRLRASELAGLDKLPVIVKRRIEGGGNGVIISVASPPRPRGRICESALPTA